MTEQVHHDIFDRGCLVQLSVSKWGGVKKLSKEQIAQMVENGNTEWVTATKKLIDPESLKPLCRVSNAARNWLASISLPFPIAGMLFVPRDLIQTVDQKLMDYRSQFQSAVDLFMIEYADLRHRARYCLGELFNEIDYPVNIDTRFKFNWRFVILNVPNGDTRLLAPEVYEREKEKFIKTMEEAREMAIAALREEFASMVERITDRFDITADGQAKIFKNTTVDSFYEFFQTFKERNIFKDAALSELVERAQKILNGSNADQIRSNECLKEDIRSGMAQVEDAMAEAFNRPRRRIVLD